MSVATGGARRKNSAAPTMPDPHGLLAWYDRHRRVLPWRAGPGAPLPDPYAVWLSEIMLQQTTVKAVAPYFAKFLSAWPTVEALAAASLDDVLRAWAGLGYYARARNLHACAKAVADAHGGIFPSTEEGLRALPGIGAYTAAAVAAIAFDQPAVPVDGNIERVVSRIFAVEDPLPGAKPTIQLLVRSIAPQSRFGDFAQALMDLGATICTPKSPACALCPWMGDCAARARGEQESFPRKAKKREGALRRGAAFVAVRADGAVLLETRPEKGLLGGMTQVPTTIWRSDYDPAGAIDDAPLAADWMQRSGVVTHVFTHFPLELTVLTARLPQDTVAPDGMRFIAHADVAAEALPNVMRKVLSHAGVELRQETPGGRSARMVRQRREE